jgi:hypothetical protein
MLKRRYLLVLPLLLLVLGVLSFGVADILATTATSYESEWRKADGVTDQQEWDKAVVMLTMAMTLNPWNPDYPESMGRFYIWRYFVYGNFLTSPEQVQSILDKGMHYIQKSIDMRPTWPRAYSTKRRLNRAAETVRLALEKQSKDLKGISIN